VLSEQRVWLRHAETGHLFECPTAAVDDWAALGWAPTDERPVEVNPVVAERLAWQAAQARAAQEQTQLPAAPAESEE
jgi:hypothetical protein